MGRILIKNAILVTMEEPNRILTNHAILVEGGIIQKILPQKSATRIKARTIDAAGKIVMPGFINAHTHFYSSLARGLTGTAPAKNFRQVLSHLWWRLDRSLTLEDCRVSALVAGIDAIRHGTTTVFDHHASPHAVAGSLDAIAEAVRDLGLRACLCYEVSDRDGRKTAEAGIEENVRFLDRCRDGGESHLRALFGLHASFTLGARTLRRCVSAAAPRGAGFHIHCAEDAMDQRITKKYFIRSVVQRLSDEGILGPKTLCAHAVHLDDREWNLLARSGTVVIHNPQSNMNNAVGIMDLAQATRKRVLVGLGTDAMTGNMLEELRGAIWAQRLRQKDPSAAFGTAIDVLIRNNQEIANRFFPKIGQLKEGWQADILCIDYKPPTEFNAASFPGHLAFGLSQAAVDMTMIGGKILMQDRKLLCLDEEKVAAEARMRSAALWSRL
jgi:putative selenium metabolism protein SsnA